MISLLKMLLSLWVGVIMVWDLDASELEPRGEFDTFPEDMLFPFNNMERSALTPRMHGNRQFIATSDMLSSDELSPLMDNSEDTSEGTYEDTSEDTSTKTDDTTQPSGLQPDTLWGDFGDVPSLDDFWVPDTKNNEYLQGEDRRVKRRAKKHHKKHHRRSGHRSTAASANAQRQTETTESYTTYGSIFRSRKNNVNAEPEYVDVPKDLYQAHLKPGVIFRVHVTEAIIKMQYREYADDTDASVVEADAEYLRLTRKMLYDELHKFEELRWLTETFTKRNELVREHECGTRYNSVGMPPTNFTGPEDYMKRSCLFDAVYLDRVPYVVGEDGSLMAAVAPPILRCDAATCTSVPFLDSLMFEDKLSPTNVRSVTRCQAECRTRCLNDSPCLERCAELCEPARN